MTGRIAESVRRCVNRILAERLDRAVKLLREHRELLELFTDELTDRNRLSGEEISRIYGKYSAPGAIA
ncbi:MAG: hypothetical protein IK093_18210 [Ruminiclostridium sp.]|nr:hypothetical protein [Ruminiclostridium sp.]